MPVRNSRDDNELSELDAIEQARSQMFVLDTNELVEGFRCLILGHRLMAMDEGALP